MVKILDEIATYTEVDGQMVHTGYFVVSDNYPLKKVLKGPWEETRQRNDFAINLDRYVSVLQNAQ